MTTISRGIKLGSVNTLKSLITHTGGTSMDSYNAYNDWQWVYLKDLKQGEFFKTSATAKKVYIREDYVRELKKFRATDYDDMNRERFIKGSTTVYVGFEF